MSDAPWAVPGAPPQPDEGISDTEAKLAEIAALIADGLANRGTLSKAATKVGKASKGLALSKPLVHAARRAHQNSRARRGPTTRGRTGAPPSRGSRTHNHSAQSRQSQQRQSRES
jgi:hypothetical protein